SRTSPDDLKVSTVNPSTSVKTQSTPEETSKTSPDDFKVSTVNPSTSVKTQPTPEESECILNAVFTFQKIYR
ncbi:hypothetical protein X975_26049, partial [Stegodyphus mimosarum]